MQTTDRKPGVELVGADKFKYALIFSPIHGPVLPALNLIIATSLLIINTLTHNNTIGEREG